MKKLTQKKIENICKDYKDYKDSPYSDGYTAVYLESKYCMTIEEMKEVYDNNRPKSKKLTQKQLLDTISNIVQRQCCYGDTSQITEIEELLKDNGYIK